MSNAVTQLQAVYLSMVQEAIERLHAATSFVEGYKRNLQLPLLESALLQLRKSLEATAFASIAPNKNEYEAFRAGADDQPDYTRDYHAKKILHALSKINRNFFPLPLEAATRQPDGTFHFGRKASGFLTKKRFESLYDRLGKHLHARNPWGTDPQIQNIAEELPTAIDEAFCLLALHATTIQTPQFSGVWVVEAPRDQSTLQIITGVADGAFVVEDS